VKKQLIEVPFFPRAVQELRRFLAEALEAGQANVLGVLSPRKRKSGNLLTSGLLAPVPGPIVSARTRNSGKA
jgi:hypothetical protein